MRYRAVEPITLKMKDEQITIPAGEVLVLTENQAERLRGKIIAMDSAPSLPLWCRADCPCLEIIPEVGPGCVRSLADGPWCEEWRQLNSMATCPKKMH